MLILRLRRARGRGAARRARAGRGAGRRRLTRTVGLPAGRPPRKALAGEARTWTRAVRSVIRLRLGGGSEVWAEKRARLVARHEAAAGAAAAGFCYRILPCLVKTGDSLLQEQFAVQLICAFQDIFDAARLPLSLHAYEIFATAPDAGLVQLVTGADSIDGLKRRSTPPPALADLFRRAFGPRSSRAHRRAERAFCSSCAAWAVVTYLLQIKDRHNGNILLRADGAIVHIDFGFLLSNSPGGNINFEAAPFKLTSEYVDLMGGARSSTFLRFRELVIKGFLAARKHADKLIALAQLTLHGAGRDMPCFTAGQVLGTSACQLSG